MLAARIWTGFWAWYLGAMRADRWAGILPTSAVTWQIDPFLSNVQALAESMEELEDEVIQRPQEDTLALIHRLQRQLVVIRRVGAPQRRAAVSWPSAPIRIRLLKNWQKPRADTYGFRCIPSAIRK